MIDFIIDFVMFIFIMLIICILGIKSVGFRVCFMIIISALGGTRLGMIFANIIERIKNFIKAKIKVDSGGE